MNFDTLVSAPITAMRGDVTIPGDKSISHRAVMLGAIAKGQTVVDGFLEADDCLRTINAFRAMGVVINRTAPKQIVIQGVGKYGLQKSKHPIDCGNSGTTMRLLSGLLAAQQFDSELCGDLSLSKRPMARIAEPLSQMGARIKTTDGRSPIYIHASQSLKGITYTMPHASAQVKSCLLLAGLYASEQTTIIEPHITRDHTERMLRLMGGKLLLGPQTVTIRPIHELQGCEINVPGDLSSAAFFMVAATLVPGASLTIRQVGINPTRIGIIDLLKQMGANIALINQRQYGEEPVADIIIQSARLQGITIPANRVSLTIDEFPILFIAAACATGTTILHGAEELKQKESNRILAMAEGLNRLGIDATTTRDGMVIQGGQLTGGEVNSFGDHRIAMAFAIAGAVASAPVMIQNAQPIATSFPEFKQTAIDCGLHIA